MVFKVGRGRNKRAAYHYRRSILRQRCVVTLPLSSNINRCDRFNIRDWWFKGRKVSRKMAWIGNKSRPISFLRNETLFTTVSTSMMSTEIYFDDGIRKFARRTTKVDEGDGGEERLIETSANRSYVLCSDVCCAIHVSSLLRSLYNAPRFDHSSFFNKFLDQRYNETYSSPNLRYYFYLSNFISSENRRKFHSKFRDNSFSIVSWNGLNFLGF